MKADEVRSFIFLEAHTGEQGLVQECTMYIHALLANVIELPKTREKSAGALSHTFAKSRREGVCN